MHHKIIIDSAKSQSGKYGPRDAFGYLLSSKDAAGELRETPPIVLRGDPALFVKAAELCPRNRRYVSIAIAEDSRPDQNSVRLARYALNLYRNHYFPGFPPGEIIDVDVLHRKSASWDAHKLIALPHLPTSRQLRPYRYTEDYFRFAWLASLINHQFKLKDPLDPANCRPLVIRERFYRAELPEWLVESAVSINARMRGRELASRDEIVKLIKKSKADVQEGPWFLTVSRDGARWTLEGFAASCRFTSLAAFEKHLEVRSKPFRDVQKDPIAVAESIRRKFFETVDQNVRLYQVTASLPKDELIIPEPKFFAERFQSILDQIPIRTTNESEKRNPRIHISGHHIVRSIGAGRVGGTESHSVRVVGSSPESGTSLGPAGPIGPGATRGTGGPDKLIQPVTGESRGHCSRGTGSPSRLAAAAQRYAREAKMYLEAIEQIAAAVLRLIALPPLLRKLSVARKRVRRLHCFSPTHAVTTTVSRSPILQRMQLSRSQAKLAEAVFPFPSKLHTKKEDKHHE